MDNTVAPVNGDDHQNTSVKTQPSKGPWKSAIFIIFVEVAERFAYYGVSGNLITYLTNGLILLTVSVSSTPIEHSRAFFFVALYILTVGEGGHKPCVQTFAADQFDENFPEEKAAKSSFFNWWYLGIVCGATAAVLVVIYVQDYVGWAVGFGMPAVAVAIALAIFLLGIGTYRKQAPVGSPFTRVAQVVVAATRKWRLSEANGGHGICYEDESIEIGVDGRARVRTLARTSQFR
ncbi:unnamed protein product [Ilex paraguariensis]|uniref:Uncharacterized protein n=1 Tax=Ilex paraguariensis TaxID=185542 RepID=A0ABC8SLG7_9AQUA